MLSERQLEALLKIFEERTRGVTNLYLNRMGEHLKQIGQLSASDVNRLLQMKRVNVNMERIKRELARMAGLSQEDIEQIFLAVAESDARFAAEVFASDHTPSVKENPALERILKAQALITKQAMENLSQTTLVSEGYRRAVDVAVQAVQTGYMDYNSAIRSAIREAAQGGLRVQYPSGVTRRLDTAVRQNILDGVRSLNQDMFRQLGKEFRSDGVELSAHALCAEDHLPYQGRQFSNREFEELQNSLARPFGMWNCKHTAHPIRLGISPPAHTETELEAYRRNSAEAITIDGRTMSRYQWTQEQRRLETAVRAQKDVAVAAKASGDIDLRRICQANINRLQDRYAAISRSAGLIEQRELMTVSGFRAVKAAKPLKKAPQGAIMVAGKAVNTTMRAQKQQEHVWGSAAFIRRTEAAKAANKSLPSAFYQDVDIRRLVMEHMGKGMAKIDRGDALSEYFSAEKSVGWTYLEAIGAYETTSRVCIRYSKKGWHAFPVKEEKDEV